MFNFGKALGSSINAEVSASDENNVFTTMEQENQITNLKLPRRLQTNSLMCIPTRTDNFNLKLNKRRKSIITEKTEEVDNLENSHFNFLDIHNDNSNFDMGTNQKTWKHQRNQIALQYYK